MATANGSSNLCRGTAPYCHSYQAPYWLRPSEHSGSKLSMPTGHIWGCVEVSKSREGLKEALQPVGMVPPDWVQAGTPLGSFGSSSVSLASCPSAQGRDLRWAIHSRGPIHP